MTPSERAAAPEPLPLAALTDAIVAAHRGTTISRACRRPPRRRAAARARAGRGAMITAMRRVNLHTADLNRDDEPEGYAHAT